MLEIVKKEFKLDCEIYKLIKTGSDLLAEILFS